MGAYLKAAVITTSDTIPPELSSCESDWVPEQSLALATYRVLEPVIHGDTAVAAAEVTSVATIDQSPYEADRYIARIQVRTDTLHWLMTHARPGAPWGVCGWSREWYSFARGTDPTVVWLSPDGSWQAVRALADSVQQGRSPQRDSVVRGLVVGPSHFPLDSTATFHAIQQQLGNTILIEQPEHYVGLCYQAVLRGDTTYVVFQTDEFGGPDRRLLGFLLSRQRPKGAWGSQCRRIQGPLSPPIHTGNDLYLGMKLVDLTAVMGAVDSVADSTFTFEYDQHVTDDPRFPEGYDTFGTLDVTVEDGMVTAMRAWYVSIS
jgi:hypothetical protein